MVRFFTLLFSFCFATTSTIDSPFFHAKGVLIHPKVVLTSAHQLKHKGSYLFHKKYKGKAIVHPKYIDNNLSYDIALIVLDTPTENLPITPISLEWTKDNIFCAKGDLFIGDSGTPFIYDNEVIAIAIAIVGENKKRYEVVYLSIYPHLEWIQKVISEHT